MISGKSRLLLSFFILWALLCAAVCAQSTNRVIIAPEYTFYSLDKALKDPSLVQKLVLSPKSNKWNHLPGAVSSFPRLRSLDFTDQEFQHLPDIGPSPELIELILDGNQISMLPQKMDAFQELYTLSLWNNQLVSISSGIGDCRKLVHLELGNNRITSVSPSLGLLTELVYISLFNNDLVDFPKSIGNLQKLSVINLENNRLSALPSEIFNL